MAKLYGEIASKALLTLDKSFARANGQPLDASEVYYSLAAAEAYAAGAQAYIGQKIVVIENGVVSHYSVEDAAGTLKELGAKPVADGTTVAIGADGKITLANVAGAAEGTYNAVLVNGVLTWVKPSETTVEGLSDLISALTGRVDKVEEDLKTEIARAKAAEEANANAIEALEGSVATQIANAVAGIVDEAPEAYDTLKEIAAWINAHPDSVATLNSAIEENAEAIEALAALVGDVAVATQITNALADYVKAADVEAVHAQVETNKVGVAANLAAIGNLAAAIEALALGDTNVIEVIKVNGVAQTPDENKAVNIIVPTKFSDLTDDSGFGDRITAAQNAGDKGIADAAKAATAATQAQSEVDALEEVVNGINTTVAGHTNSIADHLTRITKLESDDAAHKAEYEALNGIVVKHAEDIAKKADKTDVETVASDVGANAEAIRVINEVTIPAVNTEVAKKANKTDLDNYHTKDEVAAIVGDVAEGKTLVEMIDDAKDEATYDDSAVRQLIADEATRAAAAEKVNADEITRIDNALKAAVENDGEGLDSIKELATWIEEHGTDAADMAEAIEDNANAIAAINDAENGILAQAKTYTNAQIAGLPAATAEKLGLVKVDDTTIKADNGVISVKAISTDLLVQGDNQLILCGGSAID